MKKTITLAVLAAGLIYVVWQTFDLKAELGSMHAVSKQQAMSQQTLQQSINDLTAVMQNNLKQQKTPEPDVEQEEEVAGDSQSDERLSDIEEVLSHLQEQMDNLAENLTSENIQDESGQSQKGQEFQQAAPELTMEQRAQQQQARLDLIEHMVNDPAQYDSVWSPQTQQKIDKIIAETPKLEVATSSSTQCGSTICKVNATLPSDLTALEKDEFNWTLIMSMGQDLPSSTFDVKNMPDGTQELTFYFVRAGHSLPEMREGS